MGIGLPIMVAILKATNLNQNALAYATVGVMTLSGFAAMALKFRVSGKWTWNDLLIPVLFLNTSQWENIFWVVDLSHGPLAVLLLLIFALLLSWRKGWLQIAGLVTTNFLAAFTGFSIFLSPLAALYFASQAWFAPSSERRQQSITGFLGTVFTVLLFMKGYVFQTSSTCFVFPDPHPERYFKFLAYTYARAVGATQSYSLQTLIGLILCIAVIGLSLYLTYRFFRATRQFRQMDWIIACFCGYALLFGINAAIGRVCYGSQAGMASRYVTYTVVGIFALHLKLQETKAAKIVVPLFVALIVFFDLWPRHDDLIAVRETGEKKATWAKCYLQQHSIGECNTLTQFQIYPAEGPGFNFLHDRLQFLEDNNLSFFRNGP
jgi:hypothetical protein